MILRLLPTIDYHPTESAVPWHTLRQAGATVQFATQDGKPAHADPRFTGLRLGPGNPLFMTRNSDLGLYRRMTASSAFQKPLAYADVIAASYDGDLGRLCAGNAYQEDSLFDWISFFGGGQVTATSESSWSVTPFNAFGATRRP